ncbi:MAG: glycosyltransferase family 2 protein [Pseudomonadota bacterium]|nr:glycosyltransferase family 2 protein [Pseudomonadota bacterium]
MNNFTIIIPIYNESDSIFTLIDEIKREFRGKLPEIIIVNDGSTDNFINEKKKIARSVNIVSHKNNLGKCMAMLTGVKAAKNNIVCVIDGDGQNPPYEIKRMVDYWNQVSKDWKNFVLICGNRKKRQDTAFKRISSKVANATRRFILNDDCDDTACALKVFNKKDYLKIDYFKNMHRFLPALFKMKKGRIFNVLVDDRQRFAGVSKFNFNNRFWVGIIDLFKVWLLINKRRNNE